jgi:hypothetical protein
MEAPYGITTELEITGGLNGIAQIRHLMVTRKVQDTSYTTSIALPTIKNVVNSLWAYYVDDSWGSFGGTQITGEVMGFSWKLTDHIRPEWFLDGRSELDFTKSGIGRRVADLTVDIVVNPAAAGLVGTEAADKSAGTLRFISLENTGPAISGGGNYKIKIRGAYYHLSDSLQDRGSDTDGNPVVRMHLQSAYDSTSTKDLEITVNNILASFP